MSEGDVVEKVGALMSTLDDVKRYRELASAMVDFVAIFAGSLIVVVALNLVQDGYDIAYGWTSSGFGATVLGGMPASILLPLATFFIPLGGLLEGYVWVRKRVNSTKVGEWKGQLQEGVPGAVKLLSGLDWDSVLSMVRLSRVAYLFYELVKIVGYTILAVVLLFFATSLAGFLPVPALFSSQVYILFLAVIVVLLLSRKGLAEGLAKLQSLDLLFWDLRVFSTEFKRAEFNKT